MAIGRLSAHARSRRKVLPRTHLRRLSEHVGRVKTTSLEPPSLAGEQRQHIAKLGPVQRETVDQDDCSHTDATNVVKVAFRKSGNCGSKARGIAPVISPRSGRELPTHSMATALPIAERLSINIAKSLLLGLIRPSYVHACAGPTVQPEPRRQVKQRHQSVHHSHAAHPDGW